MARWHAALWNTSPSARTLSANAGAGALYAERGTHDDTQAQHSTTDTFDQSRRCNTHLKEVNFRDLLKVLGQLPALWAVGADDDEVRPVLAQEAHNLLNIVLLPVVLRERR